MREKDAFSTVPPDQRGSFPLPPGSLSCFCSPVVSIRSHRFLFSLFRSLEVDPTLSPRGRGGAGSIFSVTLPTGEKRSLPLDSTKLLVDALTGLCERVGLVIDVPHLSSIPYVIAYLSDVNCKRYERI